MHELAHRGALGAMRAAIDRAVPARLLADPHAVRDLGDDRAADRAMRADVLADGDLRRRAGGGGPASALRTLPSGSAPSAARPPAARPERRRKVRRSRRAVRLAGKRGGERAAACLAFRSLDQHGVPPSARIPVDAVEGLHVLGFPVARLALLVVGLAVGLRASSASGRRRPPRRPRRRRAREGSRDGPAFALVPVFIASSSMSSFGLRARSRRQREGLRFDLHEHPAERADAAVEVGRLGAFEIGEEAPDPRREMLLENLAIGAGRRRRSGRRPARP